MSAISVTPSGEDRYVITIECSKTDAIFVLDSIQIGVEGQVGSNWTDFWGMAVMEAMESIE